MSVSDRAPTWAGAARELAAAGLDIGRVRLELAATEIEEAQLHMAQRSLAIAAALLFGGLGLLMGAIALLLLAPPEQRPAWLALLAAMCLMLAAVAAWAWSRLGATRRPLLQSTLEQLHKDCAALSARPPAR